jgi:two-component system LytT family response regulator
MLKAIIVDDELKSRESLKILLEEYCENVRVVALCPNVREAVEAIREHGPHVVFLDIQLQRETGFDLLTQISHIDFEIIFTTAYSEYAIQAFKFSAIDYLLKPIDTEELKRAIGKVEKKIPTNMPERLEKMLRGFFNDLSDSYKLALPTLDGLVFVNIKDVTYCEAMSNYTVFHSNDGKKYIVARSLKEYESLLAEHNFFRIHNSYLINLREVKKYVRGEGGYVIMNNDVSLNVSKRRKEAFLNRVATVK